MRSVMLGSILLLTAVCIFGQTKTISASEYQSALSQGYGIADTMTHRITTVEEYFRDGKKTGFERHLNETIPPDKERYLFESEFGGKSEKREKIKIKGVSYCKEGTAKWTRASCDRFTGIPSSSAIREEFTLTEIRVDDKLVRRFRKLLTYGMSDDKKTDSIRRMYWETTFDTDQSGKLIGMESTRGHADSDDWKAISKTTYEYGLVNLRIEAPLK
jgi:hypothetical protein